jgi:hypothetical protein
VLWLQRAPDEGAAERLRRSLLRIDPEACVRIDRERRQVIVGSNAPAEALAEHVARSGSKVTAWAAEILGPA